ncbi:MAG: L,D-transpeptidase [Gemmatimonadota bacterium]
MQRPLIAMLLLAAGACAPAVAQSGFANGLTVAGDPTLAPEVRDPTRSSMIGPSANHLDQPDITVMRSLARFNRGSNLRLVVSLRERTLAALAGRDTVYRAPVGVATGLTLSYAGRQWRFRTPLGGRRVLRKTSNPVWTPPDWHYAEAARANGLKLVALPPGGVRLENGYRLIVRNRTMGVMIAGEGFFALPPEEHVIFGDKLYIPPVGTINRRVTGVLGSAALDLGGGYLIHGTTNAASVGQASSHGCLRLLDEDLEWIYANVPVGAQVIIQ